MGEQDRMLLFEIENRSSDLDSKVGNSLMECDHSFHSFDLCYKTHITVVEVLHSRVVEVKCCSQFRNIQSQVLSQLYRSKIFSKVWSFLQDKKMNRELPPPPPRMSLRKEKKIKRTIKTCQQSKPRPLPPLMDKVQLSVSSRDNDSCAPFNEQQVERPSTYDAKMQSLIQILLSKFEVDEKFAFTLQDTVNRCTSDLKAERAKNKKVQSKLNDALNQQQKEAEDFEFAKQQMASEISCLQNELEASENKRQLCEQQLQEEAETRSRFEEALEKEVAHSSRLHNLILRYKERKATHKASLKDMETENERLEEMAKKNESRFEEAIKEEEAKVADLLKSQKELQLTNERLEVTITKMIAERKKHKEVIEKLQRDLEGSSSNFSSLQQTVDQCASDLRDERTKNYDFQRDYEAAVYQQQKEAETRSRLEKAIKKEKDFFLRAYNKIKMQKEENADIRAKLKTTETEYVRMKSEHHLLSERHEEMAKTFETTFEGQSTINKLVNMVDELRAQQSESKTREGKLKQKLKQEMTKNIELQQRVDQMKP